MSDYNYIVIIGGSGSKKYLWENIILQSILINANKKKLIATICLAPICLINSGMIKNSSITAYKTKATLKLIKNSQNEYSEQNVCINDNIITANGPKALKEFAESILRKLRL